MEFSIQRTDIYKQSDKAHTLSARDYKSATDLILHGGGKQVSNPIYMSDRKGHNGITQDGTATTLNAQEKERPIIGEKKNGGDAMTSVVRRLTPLE